MIRIKMERRVKRERAENWSDEERTLLRNLIADRIDIIENKSTDTATNMQKLEAWKEIWEKFVLINSKPRTVQKLREQWKRMKLYNKTLKKKDTPIKECTNRSQSEQSQHCDNSYMSPEYHEPVSQTEYKCVRDSIMNSQKPKDITSKVFQSKNGVEYKRTMLELNRVVKEQITNCALEEHQLRMQQMREEHNYKMECNREIHLLQIENEQLKIELNRLEIEIKRKQLHDYVTIT